MGWNWKRPFFTTRSLPWGFQLKGGKFRSSIGRLNVQHPHVWDFADAPLVNRAFFGSDGLVEVGAQMNWLAPTPFYLLLGAELLQGENEASFGTASLNWPKGNILWPGGDRETQCGHGLFEILGRFRQPFPTGRAFLYPGGYPDRPHRG